MLKFSRAAMVAVLVVGASALAQDASEPKSPGGGDAPAVQKKPSNRPLRGEIESVDIEAKTLTVQTKRGGEMVSVVVATGPQTQFTLDRSPATLVDLRKGMKVVVLPDEGPAAKVNATKVKQPPKRTEDKKPKAAKHGPSSTAA